MLILNYELSSGNRKCVYIKNEAHGTDIQSMCLCNEKNVPLTITLQKSIYFGKNKYQFCQFLLRLLFVKENIIANSNST